MSCDPSDPFRDHLVAGEFTYRGRGWWPARWIAPPGAPTGAAAFHLAVTLPAARRLRLHLSADQHAELFCDGRRLLRFPERGTPARWYFHTVELDLAAGDHRLAVRLWHVGAQAQEGLVGCGPGLLLAPEPGDPLVDAIATGVAPWRCRWLPEYAAEAPQEFPAAVPALVHTVVGDPLAFTGGAGPWQEPVVGPWGRSRAGAGTWREDDRLLVPATLPPPVATPITGCAVRLVAPWEDDGALSAQAHREPEAAAWTGLLDGRPLTLPAGTRRRVLIALKEYACFWPQLVVAGGAGAELRLAALEGLYREPRYSGHTKPHRGQWDGLHAVGRRDRWHLVDGVPRILETPEWRCGRWLLLELAVGAEPLVLRALTLTATGHPLADDGAPETAEPWLQALLAACRRSLRACAHDAYQDCPYYERNQWLADARVQALTGYVMQADDRLPRKALTQFADSVRSPAGLPLAFTPARHPLVIPSFAPWFVGMLHDHACWRGDAGFVRSLLPAARATLDELLAGRDADGLVPGRPGWNYVDWIHAPGWQHGVPPDAEHGASAVLNWELVWILRQAAVLEDWCGEPEPAARWRRTAAALADAALAAFWDDGRGLLWDDRAHAHASEHTLSLALLSGALDARRHARCARALLAEPTLARTQLFFTHYLFSAYAAIGATDRFWPRLAEWRRQLDLGLDTTPEHGDPTRSDCHGWSAHPRYHLVAGIAGLQPAAPGFARLRFAPALGPLTRLRLSLPHPRGRIVADLHATSDGIAGELRVPSGVAVDATPAASSVHVVADDGG